MDVDTLCGAFSLERHDLYEKYRLQLMQAHTVKGTQIQPKSPFHCLKLIMSVRLKHS